MERRLLAAVLGALSAHAALLLLAAFSSTQSHIAAPQAASRDARLEVELSVEALEHAPPAPNDAFAELANDPPSRSKPAARAAVRATPAWSNDAATASLAPESAEGTDGSSTTLEGSPNDATKTPGGEARAIDLGLNGSLFRAELLESARRPKAARPPLVHDDWSAIAVRIASQQSGPREGSALVTIEWDADGKLRAVTTSAHSSGASDWDKLAGALRRSLSKRPKLSAEKRALRLVYLVKSELVVPHHQRSVLPRVEHGSFEALRDDQLPPAVTLNFGIKADTSIQAERLVSVTLAGSQLL